MGIVVFAGDAFIQCPLTSDYAAAKLFLRAVDPDQMPQGGTNIGAALQLSKQVLDDADRGAKDRVVVLLSDGEDLGGEVDEAVGRAQGARASRCSRWASAPSTGEPIPVLDKQRASASATRRTRTGRRCSPGSTAAGLTRHRRGDRRRVLLPPRRRGDGARWSTRIDQLQKSELESRMTVRYDERFQAFSCPGCCSSCGDGAARLAPEAEAGLRFGARRSGSRAARGAGRGRSGPLEKNHPLVERGLRPTTSGPLRGRARASSTAAQKEAPDDRRGRVQPRQRALQAGALRRGAGGLPAGGRDDARARRSSEETSTTWATRWRSWATPRRPSGPTGRR